MSQTQGNTYYVIIPFIIVYLMHQHPILFLFSNSINTANFIYINDNFKSKNINCILSWIPLFLNKKKINWIFHLNSMISFISDTTINLYLTFFNALSKLTYILLYVYKNMFFGRLKMLLVDWKFTFGRHLWDGRKNRF
jgi:hypothetical protein